MEERTDCITMVTEDGDEVVFPYWRRPGSMGRITFLSQTPLRMRMENVIF